ncbi:arginase family protein [Vibrio chagasii]|nr:arginase family protein [Vibrio chagasii]
MVVFGCAVRYGDICGRQIARMGPDAIRRASMLAWEGKKFRGTSVTFEHTSVIDMATLCLIAVTQKTLTQRLEKLQPITILSSGKTLLDLGGDHFITLPLPGNYGRSTVGWR